MIAWLPALTLARLVRLAGILHFCQVPAMMVAPQMLGWKEDLAKMQTINRRIFGVIAAAIVLTVLGLGLVVALAADQVVNGSLLGEGLAAFLAVFWAYRFLVQVVLYSKIWPGGWLGKASHYGLTLLFAFLASAYAVAFASVALGRIW
jgi:hypothetical protein